MRCGPGCAPGGAVTFFVSPKKVTKESRPHWPCPFASLRATCDARSRGGAAELASFTAFTSLRHPQRVRARSACFAAPAPRPALLGTARGEVESAHGPSLRSAFGSSSARVRWLAAGIAPSPAGGRRGWGPAAVAMVRGWPPPQPSPSGGGEKAPSPLPLPARARGSKSPPRAAVAPINPRPSAAMARAVSPSPLDAPRSAAGGVRECTAGCIRFVL